MPLTPEMLEAYRNAEYVVFVEPRIVMRVGEPNAELDALLAREGGGIAAFITARPGKRDEILAAFRANVPAVRAEQGCLEYGAAIDADPALPIQKKWGPDTFLAIEKWESMDALKAHAAAPHMAAYGAKTKELIASRVIHILTPM